MSQSGAPEEAVSPESRFEEVPPVPPQEVPLAPPEEAAIPAKGQAFRRDGLNSLRDVLREAFHQTCREIMRN